MTSSASDLNPVYKPAKLIALPQATIAAPAIACEYRSSLGKRTRLRPSNTTATAATIVTNVTRPNKNATPTTNAPLCCAAGYISSGINASHGPNTKITNSAQGRHAPTLLSMRMRVLVTMIVLVAVHEVAVPMHVGVTVPAAESVSLPTRSRPARTPGAPNRRDSRDPLRGRPAG